MKKILPNPECTKCSLHKHARTVCMRGQGSLRDADIILIGEAPGVEEDTQGTPFVGKSGQLLRYALDRTGLSEYNIYITNTVKCRPLNNKTPSTQEIKACLPYLQTELSRANPFAIVTVGAIPLKAIFRKIGITTLHGNVSYKDGILHYPIYHPAYILRNPGLQDEFMNDLIKLKQILDDGPQDNSVEWVKVDQHNVYSFFEDFYKSTQVAFDIETTSLNHFDLSQSIRTLGLTLHIPDSEPLNYIIPLEVKDSPFPSTNSQDFVLSEIGRHIRYGKRDYYAHGGKFDNLWLYTKFGIRFPTTFDTLLAHYLLDENSPHSLKSLSSKILQAPDYDISTQEKTGKKDQDLSILYEYNARDTLYTYQLQKELEPKLKKDKSLLNVYNHLLLPISRLFELTDSHGFYIDLPLFHQTQKETKTQLTKLERKLNKSAGYEVNWNSPSQISKVLFETLELKPSIYTPKGEPSTGVEALKDLEGSHPIISQLLEYRKIEKFRSTYLDGWEPFIRQNRIYFQTKIHGTVTGRFSSRLHQVPKDGSIRNLITAPPGYTFVQGDYSQGELRIAACLSNDKALLECYEKGYDVHWRTATENLARSPRGSYVQQSINTAHHFGPANNIVEAAKLLWDAGFEACKEIDPIWDKVRKNAKTINFGFIYGQSAKGFQRQLWLNYGIKVSESEAQQGREVFFSLYKGLIPWHKKQIQLAHLNGKIRSPFGRLRRLPQIHSNEKALVAEAERQAINSPVQSCLGDWKALAMISLSKRYDQSNPYIPVKILGEVHDSILFEVKTKELDTYLPIIKKEMENPSQLQKHFKTRFPIPMSVDLEIGPWGKGEKYNG